MKTGFKPKETDKPIIYYESTRGVFRKRTVNWYICNAGYLDKYAYGSHSEPCKFMGREDVYFTHLKEFHNCNPPEAREHMSKGEWE